MTYLFKVQVTGITQPPVWRRLAVPSGFTFLKFHHIIQAALGWENCHLFEFSDKKQGGHIQVSIPMKGDFSGTGLFGKTKNAARIKLSDIFMDNTRKLCYVYDFGDNWVHEITLEEILDDNAKKAVCLSGKGACPPEDCGGVYGYEAIKEIFRTSPDSEEANEYREWLGLEDDENWDANAFNIDAVNTYLKQL